MEKKVVVLFDSQCTLCLRFKKALEVIDTEKRISFKSIHEPSTYIEHPELSKQDCEGVIHLIDLNNNNVYQGSDVITFLIKSFPSVSKLSWLLDSNSAKNAIDIFYNKLNNMRLAKKNKKCYSCK